VNAEVFTEMWRESSDTSINADLFAPGQCEPSRLTAASAASGAGSRNEARETKRAAWKNLQRSAANLLAEI